MSNSKKRKNNNSKYNIEIGIPMTKSNLKFRIKILYEGIENNIYKGNDLKLAKKRLTHYTYHLELLTGERTYEVA